MSRLTVCLKAVQTGKQNFRATEGSQLVTGSKFKTQVASNRQVHISGTEYLLHWQKQLKERKQAALKIWQTGDVDYESISIQRQNANEGQVCWKKQGHVT